MSLNWSPAETEGVWLGDSNVQGPTVAIIGGIHGDELAGISTVKEGLKNTPIERGRVVLIQGNPKAIERSTRFTDANLNRSFRELTDEELKKDWSNLPYEVSRAQELMPYLDLCEAALDLHEHHSPELGPFIICERDSLGTARMIGAPIISFGWSKSESGGGY